MLERRRNKPDMPVGVGGKGNGSRVPGASVGGKNKG